MQRLRVPALLAGPPTTSTYPIRSMTYRQVHRLGVGRILVVRIHHIQQVHHLGHKVRVTRAKEVTTNIQDRDRAHRQISIQVTAPRPGIRLLDPCTLHTLVIQLHLLQILIILKGHRRKDKIRTIDMVSPVPRAPVTRRGRLTAERQPDLVHQLHNRLHLTHRNRIITDLNNR